MERKQSLRQIACELDISPAYLSYMVNGKRPWRKDLYQRYVGVVNSEQEYAYTTGGAAAAQSTNTHTKNGGTDWVRTSDLALMKRPL